MKQVFAAFVLLFGFQSELFGIEENEIIPKFYQILFSQKLPSVEDERLFFGGRECSAIRGAILEKAKYSTSKIPIWEFARDHKYIFVTRNIKDISQFRAIISDPFISVRSWNGKIIQGKRVYVSFSEKLDDPKGSSFSGFASVTFSLGDDSYINLESTTVNRSSSKPILDLVFGRDPK